MEAEVRQRFKRIDDQLDRIEANVRELSRGQRTLSLNQRVLQEQASMNAQEALDRIKAQNTVLSSIDTAANVLEEGQANIKAAIDKIRADNPTVDFTEIDAAITEGDTLIAGISSSVIANTPAETPPGSETMRRR